MREVGGKDSGQSGLSVNREREQSAHILDRVNQLLSGQLVRHVLDHNSRSGVGACR